MHGLICTTCHWKATFPPQWCWCWQVVQQIHSQWHTPKLSLHCTKNSQLTFFALRIRNNKFNCTFNSLNCKNRAKVITQLNQQACYVRYSGNKKGSIKETLQGWACAGWKLKIVLSTRLKRIARGSVLFPRPKSIYYTQLLYCMTGNMCENTGKQ